jgi:hypothetical protein
MSISLAFEYVRINYAHLCFTDEDLHINLLVTSKESTGKSGHIRRPFEYVRIYLWTLYL